MTCAGCGREAERLPIGKCNLDDYGRIVRREHVYCCLACSLGNPCACPPEPARQGALAL